MSWARLTPTQRLVAIILALAVVALNSFLSVSQYRSNRDTKDDLRTARDKLTSLETQFKQISNWYNELSKTAGAQTNTILAGVLDELAKAGKWQQTFTLAKLMLAIDSTDQTSLNYLGQYYRQYMNDCAKATDEYTKSINVNSGNKFAADAYVFRGICYYGLRMQDPSYWEKAEADFARAVAIDYSYKDAGIWLACVKSRRNDCH